MTSMRTLSPGLRVADLDASLAFYRALGFETVGTVPETELGRLTMLKLPDDEFVTLELVHDPQAPPTSDTTTFSHFAVHVKSVDAAVKRLSAAGICAEPVATPGPGLRTTNLTDPDGRTIELVEWPPGHPEGMTAADLQDVTDQG
jgi:lactoylglutathione lyase